MGYFDLPSGDFELLFGDNGTQRWESVMFTDSLSKSDIADCVEQWGKKYKILGARYNGKDVAIPVNYHWEMQKDGETLGRWKTREEASEDMNKRRRERKTDKTILIGRIVFVQD